MTCYPNMGVRQKTSSNEPTMTRKQLNLQQNTSPCTSAGFNICANLSCLSTHQMRALAFQHMLSTIPPHICVHRTTIFLTHLAYNKKVIERKKPSNEHLYRYEAKHQRHERRTNRTHEST